ncbi:MAG: hypothetical protein WD378_04940 [Egicoccus sp.]
MVLHLEEFEQVGAFLGGGHELQVSCLVREQDPRLRRDAHRHDPFGQRVEEFDHVEVFDQRVRELDEGVNEPMFALGRHGLGAVHVVLASWSARLAPLVRRYAVEPLTGPVCRSYATGAR